MIEILQGLQTASSHDWPHRPIPGAKYNALLNAVKNTSTLHFGGCYTPWLRKGCNSCSHIFDKGLTNHFSSKLSMISIKGLHVHGTLLRNFFEHHRETVQRIVMYRVLLTSGFSVQDLGILRNQLGLEHLHSGELREKKQWWHSTYAIQGINDEICRSQLHRRPEIIVKKNGIQPFLNDTLQLWGPMVVMSSWK